MGQRLVILIVILALSGCVVRSTSDYCYPHHPSRVVHVDQQRPMFEYQGMTFHRIRFAGTNRNPVIIVTYLDGTVTTFYLQQPEIARIRADFEVIDYYSRPRQ